ncbi:MAG TPA: hypothetical protein VKU41_01745 [Polyangiaceae bacterium]|nr:hypothetical protein [Polyangiaceae bacterium]
MKAPLVIRWAFGGEGRLLSLDGDAVAIRSTVSSPPGSRIEGTVSAGQGSSQGARQAKLTLRVKVHSSKRAPEGDFVLEGRALDLSRRARDVLDRLLAD